MTKRRAALTSKPAETKTIERQQRRLTKQQKKLQEELEQHVSTPVVKPLSIKTLRAIEPKTDTQSDALESLHDSCIDGVVLAGSAGTGKTFLAIHSALSKVFQGEYDKVIIIRSIVSVRDLGFLPGLLGEKIEPYEAPYHQICAELFGRKDAYEKLKDMGKVEFSPSSFLRGISLRNSVVIVDEAQSNNWHELNTIMTRIGEGSKLIVCGDGKQNDLIKTKNDSSGFFDFMAVSSRMSEFRTHKFTRDDIVRSGFVKSWIVACENIGL
jgi:predicted ribonuclease YlaK